MRGHPRTHTRTRTRHRAALGLAVGLAALALWLGTPGCRSYDRLLADDPGVREDEVHAAGVDADRAELGPHLVHILAERERYPSDVVVAALVAVGRRGEPEAVPAVAALARDRDEEVRYHVARALRALGGAEAERALDDMRRNDAAALVRAAAGAGEEGRP